LCCFLSENVSGNSVSAESSISQTSTNVPRIHEEITIVVNHYIVSNLSTRSILQVPRKRNRSEICLLHNSTQLSITKVIQCYAIHAR